MTYRDLVRRSEHPHAGGRAHRVTNPAAGYLPEPRTRVDEYDAAPRATGHPGLPYAGTSPPGVAEGIDWAIREWAVRVWAARDHGTPDGAPDQRDGHRRDETPDATGPRLPGNSDPTAVDWESLDADSRDVAPAFLDDTAPLEDTAPLDGRSRDQGALESRLSRRRLETWLDADAAPDDDLDRDPAADDLAEFDDLAELVDADGSDTVPPATGYRPRRDAQEAAPAPAGAPPPQLYAAAILTAVLSLPLLLSAGVLVAVSAQAGIAAVLALLLAIAAVAGAAGDVVAALRLADRGDPGLARTGGYVTLAGAVVSAGWLLLGGGAANVLFPIWASFGVLAIAMFALLGSGACRDWLTAREWERRAAGGRRRR